MGEGYFRDNTIAALATAQNALGPIAIVRLSGPESSSIFLRIAKKHGNQLKFSLEDLESHRIRRCLLFAKNGSLLDDAMFVYMRAPNSFTGEDIVELHVHGNPISVNRIISSLIEFGATPALPGEFSFRAFRNGKMDLSQAEAVMDIISSRSGGGLESALKSLLGSTKNTIERLRSDLVHLLAMVEVDIDFSDQGLSVLNYEEWSARLQSWDDEVRTLRDRFLSSQPMRDGVRVALVGDPNSGKSTLFNALLGQNRSIVSDIAGTTRDVVREGLSLSGNLFLFSDTAGLRSSSDPLEAEGIRRSLDEASNAHIILWVLDSTAEPSEDELRHKYLSLKARSGAAEILVVLTKQDLLPSSATPDNSFFSGLGLSALRVSAKLEQGLRELEQGILGHVSRNLDQEGFAIGRMRHFELLGRAQEGVERALSRVKSGSVHPDLLSGDLRLALGALGEITGEVATDEVLNHIFSTFCIGK